MLRAEHIRVRYGEKTAVDDVSLRVEAGQWWTIAGPNGAGKTSLAAALTRGVKHDGKVFLHEREAETYKTGEYARKVGMLSQINGVIYGFTVSEVVNMGRYAHRRGFLRGQDPEGEEKVGRALELTGLQDFRNRSLLTLSGGEIQRVFLAQVLAQDPELLILDEPANHLDLPFQKSFFDMVREWLESPGRAVITVMHDLTLAKRYGTHALLMSGGRTAAYGTAAEVLTAENLREAYGMDVAAWMRESLAVWAKD